MRTILTSLFLCPLILLPGCMMDRIGGAIAMLMMMNLETSLVAPPVVAFRQEHGRWPSDWAEVAGTSDMPERLFPESKAMGSSVTFEVVPGGLAVMRRGKMPDVFVDTRAKRSKAGAPTTSPVEDPVVVSFIISDDSTLDRIRLLSPDGDFSGYVISVRPTEPDEVTSTTLPTNWSMAITYDPNNPFENRLRREPNTARPSTLPVRNFPVVSRQLH